MNDLRERRRSRPGTAINGPGRVRFQGGALMAKELQPHPQDNPQKVINEPTVVDQTLARRN
jgi:hypothetical protein